MAETVTTRSYFTSLIGLLKKKILLALVVVTAGRSMGQAAIMVFLPVYLREDLEFSLLKVAVYLALGQVVGAGAQPLMGYFSDKFGRKVVLVPSMAMMGVLFFVLARTDGGLPLILTILALGTFLYSLHTLFIAAAMDIAGGEVQSTVVSLIYGASFLGTLSPIIAGAIADSQGIPAAFVYGGVVILISTAILAMMKLPKTANQIAASASSE